MTPQLIEAIGIFIVFPICVVAAFWKLLNFYNQPASHENPYQQIIIEARKRVHNAWRTKSKETETKP